jgi:hypothetical protein
VTATEFPAGGRTSAFPGGTASGGRAATPERTDKLLGQVYFDKETGAKMMWTTGRLIRSIHRHGLQIELIIQDALLNPSAGPNSIDAARQRRGGSTRSP